MADNNIYIEIQPEMIRQIKKELAEGSSIYDIYAKYSNMSIREEFEGGDIETITKCQFVCDLAKHMITEKAMKEKGFEKSGDRGLWRKEDNE